MTRLWFYLNGARGEACLAAAVKAGFNIAGIVVPPPKRAKYETIAHGINCRLESPTSINAPAFIQTIRNASAGLGVIAGFSTIASAELIAAHQRGMFNLHAGDVPRYRGGSPLNWQIINGECFAGLCVLRVQPGIDDGPVLARTTVPIEPSDDIASLHRKANEAFPDLLLRALRWEDENESPYLGEPQDEAEACYWHQRSDSDGCIDWTQPARRVHDFVRALTRPYPGAWTGNTRIWRTSLDGMAIRGRPGRVCRIRGSGPYVCCTDRAVLILESSGAPLRHGAQLRPSALEPPPAAPPAFYVPADHVNSAST